MVFKLVNFVSKESSAHINFKNQVIEASEGDTILTMKDIISQTN